MYVPDYHLATNSAYEILVKCQFQLPIKISSVLKLFGDDIKVISYSKAAKKENISHSEIVKKFASDYGFIARDPYDPWRSIIYYNDKKSPQTIRFTLAHELGHYVLGHLDDDEVSRKEANCFARNILCPAPVRFIMAGNIVNQCIEVFDTSERMATTTVELLQSDLHYIKKEYFDTLYLDYQFYSIFHEGVGEKVCTETIFTQKSFYNSQKKPLDMRQHIKGQ